MPSRLMDWGVRSQVWIQVTAASLSPGLHICKMGLTPPTLSLSWGLMRARYISPLHVWGSEQALRIRA